MKNKNNLYILKFKSFPQFLRFGGNLLYNSSKQKEFKNQKLAELWEISGHKKHSSIIKNGIHKGKNLNDLCKIYKNDLYGTNVKCDEKNPFPLMLRLLDCQEDLPPAIHPDDEYCKDINIDEKGKIEAWYIIDSKKNSKIYSGFNTKIKRDKIQDINSNGEIFKYLKCYNSKPNDVYLIPPKRPHSIGSGNLVYEIQTTSNAIFPFDWLNWEDKNEEKTNNDKEAFIKLVDLDTNKKDKKEPKLISTIPNKHYLLAYCKQFCLEKYIVEKFQKFENNPESFKIITCISGNLIISTTQQKLILKELETVLIPNCITNYNLKPNKKSLLLSATIYRESAFREKFNLK